MESVGSDSAAGDPAARRTSGSGANHRSANGGRPRLIFVSPQFLLPPNIGGKIRTVNILKGLKGGAFEVHLVSPATRLQEEQHTSDLQRLCDRFTAWRLGASELTHRLRRVAGLMTGLPISVWSDARQASRRAVTKALAEPHDLAVVDFTHGAVIWPDPSPIPAVLFTHNVEAEIYERHAAKMSGLERMVWNREARTMRRFEGRAALRFDTVVTVSERDAHHFEKVYGARCVRPIPTGVDLDFFEYQQPPVAGPKRVVFTGSMNWKANQTGIAWFLEHVWSRVAAAVPDATFTVIGRDPPGPLVEAAHARGFRWQFTGFVDDIRDHALPAHACVIPLLVGGGTRLKAYEAMAMGVTVVSTTLGVEGLPLEPDQHCLVADEAADFADRLIDLLINDELRLKISRQARRYVEDNFGHRQVARVFEDICLQTLARVRPASTV